MLGVGNKQTYWLISQKLTKSDHSGFHLYYFHSACLVLIAGLIIEVIASAKSISCIPDLARAIKTLKSAEIYLSMDPNEPKSILPRLPSGPARSTARNCNRIITGLTAHVLAAAPHMFSPAPFRGNSQREATNSARGLKKLSCPIQRISIKPSSTCFPMFRHSRTTSRRALHQIWEVLHWLTLPCFRIRPICLNLNGNPGNHQLGR